VLAYFQVKEARTLLSGVIVTCAIFGFMILEFVCCRGCLDYMDSSVWYMCMCDAGANSGEY